MIPTVQGVTYFGSPLKLSKHKEGIKGREEGARGTDTCQLMHREIRKEKHTKEKSEEFQWHHYIAIRWSQNPDVTDGQEKVSLCREKERREENKERQLPKGGRTRPKGKQVNID